MVPLLVQSRDVPPDVRAALRTFMDAQNTRAVRRDAGCEAAVALQQSFDLSQNEVGDLLGFEAGCCA